MNRHTRHLAVLLVALLAACAKVPPRPAVFPGDPPPMEEPLAPELGDPPADELPTVVAYVPGQPAPFTDSAGLVTHRGVLLPESKALELYATAEAAAYWEERARICHTYRLADRAYCGDVVGRMDADLDYATREARWVRWAIPVAVTAGILLGAGAVAIGSGVGQ